MLSQTLIDQVGFWGGIASFIFGIISVYFYFKSKRFKKPVLVYQSSVLQTTAHPEVTILFQNEKIVNLSKLTILFWNAGNREIRADDVPTSGQPSIIFLDNARILSYTVKATSSEEIKFKVQHPKKDQLSVNFEYLNPSDGGVIEVLYESPLQSKGEPIKAKGAIIGAKEIEQWQFEKPLSRSEFFILLSLITIVFIMGIALVVSSESITRRIFGIGVGSFALLGYWANIRKQAESVIPKFASSHFD